MVSGLKLFDLNGKTALITGSSQGIGYALAKGLADAGSDIILNGRTVSYTHLTLPTKVTV